MTFEKTIKNCLRVDEIHTATDMFDDKVCAFFVDEDRQDRYPDPMLTITTNEDGWVVQLTRWKQSGRIDSKQMERSEDLEDAIERLDMEPESFIPREDVT